MKQILTNVIYRGDCINMANRKLFPNESVDLIYLDPPFSSNRNYSANYKDNQKIRLSFRDTWKGDLEAYIDWMKPRVKEMHRVLRSTGSIYYHCDYHANHYIRILLDDVFGPNNFRNEIIWCYSGGGISKNNYPRKHDNIFRYSKTSKCVFNIEYKPYKDNTQMVGQHSTLSKSDDISLNQKGTPITDWWNDISTVTGWAVEKVGYPTQKPLPLLDRIIKASSNEGDVVLDPFMGSGTTLVSAGLLHRKFIGIDINPNGCDIGLNRLHDEFVEADIKNLPTRKTIKKVGDEPDSVQYMRQLSNESPFMFQDVCCDKCGYEPNKKRSGDHGIDGYDKYGNPVQVKGSDDISERHVRDLAGAATSLKKDRGIFIAFSYTKASYEWASKLKRETGVTIELRRVNELPHIDIRGITKKLSDFKGVSSPNSAVHKLSDPSVNQTSLMNF